jgi:hypothetical protein
MIYAYYFLKKGFTALNCAQVDPQPESQWFRSKKQTCQVKSINRAGLLVLFAVFRRYINA